MDRYEVVQNGQTGGGRMWRGDRLQNWAHMLMLELSSCIHSFPGGFYFFLLPNCWLCLILGKLPPTCCTTGGSRRHVEESSVKTAGEKVSRETERKAGLQNLC
jgi:hypothetical protein